MDDIKKYQDLFSADRNDFSGYFKNHSDLLNCFQPLLKILGWTGNARFIAESLPHFSEALSISGLKRVMRHLNYNTHSFSARLQEIDARLFPCLFISENNNVLLALEKKDDKFIVYDGESCETKEIGYLDYQGAAYIFKETKDKDRSQSKGASHNWFLSIVAKFKVLIYKSLFITFLTNIIMLAIPIFVMSVYDRVIGTQSISLLVNLSIGLFVALFFMIVLSIVRSRILSYVSVKLDEEISEGVFARLISLPLAYVENATIGSQISHLKSIDSVREFFTSSQGQLLLELPFIIISVSAIAFIGKSLAVVPVVMVCVFFLLMLITNSISKQRVRTSAEFSSERQTFLIEALNSQRTLKFSSIGEVWLERYKKASSKAIYSNFKMSIINSAISSLSNVIVIMSGLFVIAFGAIQVMDGTLSIGALVAIMLLIWRILAPIKTVFISLPHFNQILFNIRKLNSLMRITPETEYDKVNENILSRNNSISFHRVSFRYHQNLDPALMGVNFSIRPGEWTLVSGAHGSGKSSLLKLLLRLYAPQAGGIMIGGKDIRQFDPKTLRSSIAYISQKNNFFYGTINQNFRLANPLATQEEIINACKYAGIYEEVIKLPEQFESRIGDQRNFALSQIFQQRLSLARAFVKKSPIILMDEPAIVLDEETKLIMANAFSKLRGKVTVVMISQDKTFFKYADRVLFIKSGQLVYDGNPEQTPANLIEELR